MSARKLNAQEDTHTVVDEWDAKYISQEEDHFVLGILTLWGREIAFDAADSPYRACSNVSRVLNLNGLCATTFGFPLVANT